MTALAHVATDAHGQQINPDGSVAREERPPDELASVRALVRSWLHGIDLTTTGGQGGRIAGGHPDRGMDSVAQEADILRCIATLDPRLQAVCRLARVLSWRSDTMRVREATGRVDDEGAALFRDRLKTRWTVRRGWAAIVDPFLAARVPSCSRLSVRAWQTTVRAKVGSDTGFYLALGEAVRLISLRLGPYWLTA